MQMRLLISVLACAAMLAVAAQAAGHSATPTHDAAAHQTAPLLGTLGSYSRPIDTDSSLAQRYFDEGLALTYGAHQAGAVRSFRDALTVDPKCAMCAWGIALALGPAPSAPMDMAAVEPAYAAVQLARELMPYASVRERMFIEALAKRYGPTPVADRTALDVAYADAMRDLTRLYPDDDDAAVLFAEALMDLPPGQTTEITATFEKVLARNPAHPGVTNAVLALSR